MHVLIAGAGPAGGLLAFLLSEKGYTVTVYDKRNDPRADVRDNTQSDRYVGLLLTVRGEAALQRCGVTREDLAQYSSVVTGRRIHHTAGSAPTELDWGCDSQWRAIDRMALMSDVVGRAEQAGARFTFNKHITAVDFGSRSATLSDGTCEAFDLIVGADGVNSKVRSEAGIPFDVKQLEVGYCWVEVATQMDKSRVNVWPHPEGIIHGLPSAQGTLNCTVVAKLDTLHRFTEDAEACHAYCQAHLAGLVEIAPDLGAKLHAASKGSFRRVSCERLTNAQGSCVLIGDAAHSMAPFLGQGMNCSLEDAVVLADTLRADSIPQSLGEFASARKPEMDACHQLVDEQERYFTQLVTQWSVQARIKLHAWMRRLFPSFVCPQVREMVNSHDYTYTSALELQRRQNQWWCLGRVYE